MKARRPNAFSQQFRTVRPALFWLFLNGIMGPVLGQEPSPLRVRIEAGEGPHYVGEGIELAVAVTGRDQRPKIDLPRPSRAESGPRARRFGP